MKIEICDYQEKNFNGKLKNLYSKIIYFTKMKMDINIIIIIMINIF